MSARLGSPGTPKPTIPRQSTGVTGLMCNIIAQSIAKIRANDIRGKLGLPRQIGGKRPRQCPGVSGVFLTQRVAEIGPLLGPGAAREKLLMYVLR